MADKFKVIFNEAELPSFVKVQTVGISVLPEITNNLKGIAGGYGMVDTGISIGSKTISLNVIIVQDEGVSLAGMSRELAYWLRGDNFKLSELRITDENEMTYMAKINTGVDLTDLLFAGTGTIEFIVPSGLAKSSNETPTVCNSTLQEIYIDYYGTGISYPVIEFHPSGSGSDTVLNITCLETGETLSINTGAYTAETVFNLDNRKKLVKKDGSLALTLINLDSDWINLLSRGYYTLTYNIAGTAICTVDEYWL